MNRLFRSLHIKLTLILLLLITSLMAVVGAFLTTSVTSFYIDSFYQQMSSAFGADRKAFVADLRSAAGQPDGADRIQEILEVNAGMLGIDYRTRNYYVLDGTSGTYLVGSSDAAALPREQSANLLTARNAVAQAPETPNVRENIRISRVMMRFPRLSVKSPLWAFSWRIAPSVVRKFSAHWFSM